MKARVSNLEPSSVVLSFPLYVVLFDLFMRDLAPDFLRYIVRADREASRPSF